ncbi:MAG: hypothetical protein R2761_20835 [Acidimicrobiales bacterium]
MSVRDSCSISAWVLLRLVLVPEGDAGDGSCREEYVGGGHDPTVDPVADR